MEIVAIMGKSGSGKTTLEQKLESIGMHRIVTYTTRDRRPGEINHVDYHFVTHDQFSKLIESNILIEWTEYNGNMYGAPYPVGYEHNVIVMEPSGVQKLKDKYGDQVFGVYMDTPDDCIEERLLNRGDTKDIKSRKETDAKLFQNVTSLVDLVVTYDKPVNEQVVAILGAMTRR